MQWVIAPVTEQPTTSQLEGNWAVLKNEFFSSIVWKALPTMASEQRANGARFLFLSLLLLLLFVSIEITEAKRRVSIPDELDDVVDEEEDEDWKQWGQTKNTGDEELKSSQPPIDFSKMSPEEIQAEISRSQTGPSFGFVKLRLGVTRSREDVPLIAMKWSKIVRTGSIEVKFMAVDLNTIMFTMEKGQDTEELKEFILSQPEAYEMKIGNQFHRRPGDPPLDEVIALNQRKNGNDMHDSNDEL